jgi:CRP-like cAMP-binding protein
LSLFYSPADEGDVVIFTSDGVYDNLDPQSFGIPPSELGLEGDAWDTLTDWKRIEEVKTAYVCEMIRQMVFGPKEKNEDVFSDDSLAAPMAIPAAPRPSKLDVNEIVETLISHAIKTTQSSRDFMENYPDKILPKNYKDYPGKLDHTTCVGLMIKRSTFKPIENELDSLVLRMRNPAQGLSTVKTPLGGFGLNLRSSTADAASATVVPLTRGEGIESPRYKDLDLTTETASSLPDGFLSSSFDASSTVPLNTSPTPTNPILPPPTLGTASGSSTNTPSTSAVPPISLGSSGGGTGQAKSKPTALKRSNTILNVAIRGGVILKWLKENEKMLEAHAAKVAQMLLGFRYIRPLDVENWKNETFGLETSYNFQVYEPIMTRNDWEQLLKSSKRVAYEKDALIVKEGEDAKQRLFYIISGKCRTVKSVPDSKEKKPRKDRSPDRRGASSSASSSGTSSSTSTTTEKDGSSTQSGSTLAPGGTRHAKLMKKTKGHPVEPRHDITVNVMCENETFGEISFLFGQKATAKASASVVADENVDLYIIEGSWINILFVKYPGMAGRFYHYLASVLAHRLKKQEILESQRTPPTP